MKLSELVEHTGKWLNYSATSVGSFARFLREARQISGGVKGGGAADMTADDKISLLVAVLGCGTARTCAHDLPKLLALPPSTGSNSVDTKPLRYFAATDLKAALLLLFNDIATGRVDEWQRNVNTAAKPKIELGSASLSLTFEIDANHVAIRLMGVGPSSIARTRVSIEILQEYGFPPPTTLPGHSRRIHEVSYERLVGWGLCLRDGA